MKKLAVTFQLMLLLLLNNNLSAQDMKPNSFQLGFRFAPNISWLKLNTQDYNSDGSLLKFSWGLVTDFRFANNYYFSTGLNFNACGGKMTYPTLDTANRTGKMSQSFNLRYLEVPLMLKMKTHQFKSITYYGIVGIGVGLLINANADKDFLPAYSTISYSTTNVDVKAQVRDFKLSLIIGAGAIYSLGGSTALFGELRFNNGFTNILYFNNNISPYTPASAVPNSFDLGVGIMF